MRCCSGQATTAAAVYFLTGRGVACRTEAAGSDSTVVVEGRAVEGHRCGRMGEVGSAANSIRSVQASGTKRRELRLKQVLHFTM